MASLVRTQRPQDALCHISSFMLPFFPCLAQEGYCQRHLCAFLLTIPLHLFTSNSKGSLQGCLFVRPAHLSFLPIFTKGAPDTCLEAFVPLPFFPRPTSHQPCWFYLNSSLLFFFSTVITSCEPLSPLMLIPAEAPF